MGIKAGDPELTFLGNAQIIQSISDVRIDLAPEKPGELRSRWLGHAVKDGSPTTKHYEHNDPHELTDVALAVDCVMALIQEHCGRPLFSTSDSWAPRGRPSFTADKLRTRRELERIGATVIPKMIEKP